MVIANMHEAKTEFSRLIHFVENGEEVIIVSPKQNGRVEVVATLDLIFDSKKDKDSALRFGTQEIWQKHTQEEMRKAAEIIETLVL